MLGQPPREGVRKGSASHLKQVIEDLTAYARRLEAAGFDPASVPGLTEPKPYEVKKRKRDMSRTEVSEGGSATLRKLNESAAAKRAEKEAEQLRLMEVRADRANKKEAAADQLKAIKYWYAACKGPNGCQCRQDPCCVEKYKYCEYCDSYKMRVCSAPACIAARGPSTALVVAQPQKGRPKPALPPPPVMACLASPAAANTAA